MESQTRRMVFEGDPALDTKEMKIRGPGGYGETRDPGLVRVLPGRVPVWFTVRFLTPRESIIVDERGALGPLWKVRQAVSAGLVSVQLATGETRRPATSVPDPDAPGGSKFIWDDVALNDLWRTFGKAAMVSIGTAILEMDERPGEAFANGDDVRFTLLPSSLAALEANERRIAARPPTESPTQS